MRIISASFQEPNTNNDVVVAQTDQGEVTIPLPPQQEIVEGSQAVFSEWMSNGGGIVSGWVEPVPPKLDPILAAEDWVQKFFSQSQLLQLAVWVQQRAAANAVGPKLGAVYQWEQGITFAAIQGAMEFPEAPHTFSEVAKEVLTNK